MKQTETVTGFTPGPWEIVGTSIMKKIGHNNDSWMDIATISHMNWGNAQLIAAAPAMFQALLKIANNDQGTWSALVDDVRNIAQSALAQAQPDMKAQMKTQSDNPASDALKLIAQRDALRNALQAILKAKTESFKGTATQAAEMWDDAMLKAARYALAMCEPMDKEGKV